MTKPKFFYISILSIQDDLYKVFVNKQNLFICLFIKHLICITMKLCINHLEHLKYLYKKIQICHYLLNCSVINYY